jgi:hypothetical protein
MSDYERFHVALLGKKPEPGFELTPSLRTLYTELREVGEVADQDLLGVVVMALKMTSGGQHPVVLLVSEARQSLLMNRVRDVARYSFRLRNGDATAVQVMRQAFQKLYLTKPGSEFREPERWVFAGMPKPWPVWITKRCS